MKNIEPHPATPDIRFNFHRARRGTVVGHAEAFLVGNVTDIHIPAGRDQALTVEWTSPADLTIIELATHQHQLGTDASVEIGAPDGLLQV
jgi:hypothetical protein